MRTSGSISKISHFRTLTTPIEATLRRYFWPYVLRIHRQNWMASIRLYCLHHRPGCENELLLKDTKAFYKDFRRICGWLYWDIALVYGCSAFWIAVALSYCTWWLRSGNGGVVGFPFMKGFPCESGHHKKERRKERKGGGVSEIRFRWKVIRKLEVILGWVNGYQEAWGCTVYYIGGLRPALERTTLLSSLTSNRLWARRRFLPLFKSLLHLFSKALKQ
jgi:hypothetical protein